MAIFGGIPLPKVVADVEPGGGVFTSYNAVSKAGLANKKQQLENQYFVPQLAAKLKLLEAQANNQNSDTAKNQFQVQNPAYMSPEGFLFSQAAGGNTGGNASQGGSQSQTSSDNSYAYNPDGSNKIGDPQEILDRNAKAQSQSSNPFASDGNKNPLSELLQTKLHPISTAQQQAQNAANVATNTKLIGDAAGQANSAVDMSYALDAMKKAYPDLHTAERGSLVGHLPAVSSAAQKFDHGAATLNAALVRANQTQHITDKDINFFSQLGINRTLNPEAFKSRTGFVHAIQNRIKEKAPFYAAAQQAGLPPSVYQPLYSMYLNEKPVYDFDSGKPIKENQNTWKDYLKPEAIQSMMAGKPYAPRLANRPSSSRAMEQTGSNVETNNSNNEMHRNIPNYSQEARKMAETLQLPDWIKNDKDFIKWKNNIKDPTVHQAIDLKWGGR